MTRRHYTPKQFVERPITILNPCCCTCGDDTSPLIRIVGTYLSQCGDCIGRPTGDQNL